MSGVPDWHVGRKNRRRQAVSGTLRRDAPDSRTHAGSDPRPGPAGPEARPPPAGPARSGSDHPRLSGSSAGGGVPPGIASDSEKRLLSYLADMHSVERQALVQMQLAPRLVGGGMAADFHRHE